jgi:hypothetical protein
MRRHYPAWDLTRDLDTIFKEMVESWQERAE